MHLECLVVSGRKLLQHTTQGANPRQMLADDRALGGRQRNQGIGHRSRGCNILLGAHRSRRCLHVGSAIAVIVVIVTAEVCVIAVARHPRCRALVIGQEVQDPAPLWMRKYDLLYISPGPLEATGQDLFPNRRYGLLLGFAHAKLVPVDTSLPTNHPVLRSI